MQDWEREITHIKTTNHGHILENSSRRDTELQVRRERQVLRFLDINPLAKGHTLVIPRREVDYFFDLEDDELAEMAVFAKRVAKAIKAAFPCRKVGMAVLGLEVAHAHIHLVPMQSEGDMNFANPKLKLAAEEFEDIAKKIRENF